MRRDGKADLQSAMSINWWKNMTKKAQTIPLKIEVLCTFICFRKYIAYSLYLSTITTFYQPDPKFKPTTMRSTDGAFISSQGICSVVLDNFVFYKFIISTFCIGSYLASFVRTKSLCSLICMIRIKTVLTAHR